MLTIKNPKKFDWKNMPLSDCCEGNAMDSYFTLKLFNLICEKMEKEPMFKLIEEIMMPSLEIFSEIEYNGMDVDPSVLGDVGKNLRSKNMDEEDFLYTCNGVAKTDNLASNADLIEILYTREGSMEMYPPDKTAKGKPSVSAPTLKLLLEHVEEELSNRE
jgi:DNA polymerase I-like protein with 3'-5' exonuclease and polymerase domains